VEHVFLFCVSDVTFTTPNSARCSGSVLLSADAARWRGPNSAFEADDQHHL
jgi:hypothetical protein